MSTIEILATVFSIMVITKIVALLAFPSAVLKFADTVFKYGRFLVLINILLAGFVGYLLLCDLKVEEIAAVLLFAFYVLQPLSSLIPISAMSANSIFGNSLLYIVMVLPICLFVIELGLAPTGANNSFIIGLYFLLGRSLKMYGRPLNLLNLTPT